jgi:uncharacterized repeat protein (TIGR03803 family)
MQPSLAIRVLALSLACVTAAHAHGPIDRIASMLTARGGSPNAGAVLDASGNAYVANAGFGKNGIGSLVEFSPPAQGQTKWTTRVIWSFSGSDGAAPDSVLTPDGKGGFYGTANQGGTYPFGVVYEIDPTGSHGKWSLDVLWNFTGYGDGGFPVGGVIADAAGNLYGTATIGGGGPADPHPFGVVYQLVPPTGKNGKWQEHTLVRFIFKNGYSPECTLLMDASGTLFGTTYGGGKFKDGTVFKLAPPAQGGNKWTHEILYDFADKGDGSSPFAGLIEDKAGNLYGTTYGSLQNGSDGTVFEVSPPANRQTKWAETTVWKFAGGTDGLGIFAGLYADPSGNLWGAAIGGGTHGDGALFKLTPPAQGETKWTKTDVGDFNGTDGDNPMGTLALGPDGNLYGTTFAGGVQNFGAVFKIK